MFNIPLFTVLFPPIAEVIDPYSVVSHGLMRPFDKVAKDCAP